jgi:hypothetical protein
LISASFSDFASKSKIPPELIAAGFEIGDVVGDGVEAFGFHVGWLLGVDSERGIIGAHTI